MTGNEVNAILVAFTDFKATVTAKLDAISSDNTRGDQVHQDHETRIRNLEARASESRGVWKVVTAGGVVGAVLGASAMRLLGLA